MPKIKIKASVAAMLIPFLVSGDIKFTAALLAAAALHELGHIAAMFMTGRPPESITICAFGAVIARKPGLSAHISDLAVYMAGCAVNLICAGAFYLLAPDFSRISAALCIFNLLPLEGFDGYAALESLLASQFSPRTTDRVCKAASMAMLMIIWAAAVYLCLYRARGVYILAMCVYLTAGRLGFRGKD